MSDRVRQVTAMTLRGSMGQGTAGAQLLVDMAGKAWVMKFRQNDQGPRSLVNELLGFQLASFLQIPHPEFALVQVDSNVLPPGGVIRYHYQAGNCERTEESFVALPGLHFATRLVTSTQQLRPADLDHFLQLPIDLEVLAGIVVLDLVVNHWDRRPLNPNLLLTRDRTGSNPSRTLHKLVLIDMGMSIGGGCWELGNLLDASFPPLEAPLPYGGPMAYLFARTDSNMIETKARQIGMIAREVIEGMIQAVPESWNVSGEVRTALGAWILERSRAAGHYLAQRCQKKEWWQ